MKKKIMLLCLGMCSLAVGIVIFKILFLHFSLLPSPENSLWILEFKADFMPLGGPVKATLRLPTEIPGFRLEVNGGGRDYAFAANDRAGEIVAEWHADSPAGEQQLQCGVKLIPDAEAVRSAVEFSDLTAPIWADQNDRKNAEAVWRAFFVTGKKYDTPKGVSSLIKFILKRENRFVRALFPDPHPGFYFAETICRLLAMKGIKAVPVSGIYLADGKRKAQHQLRICAELDGKICLFEPSGGELEAKNSFIILKTGDPQYFKISGARKIRTSLSPIKSTFAACELSRLRENSGRSGWIWGLFGQNLPVEEQNIFKKLAMLPLAILVLVVIRNMVGLQTMGTFMPVLIALAFLETGLGVGMVAFGLVMSIGLLVRRGLSALQLLLVPRISAVVIIVIMLMKMLSIIAEAMGIIHGAAVTFFPLIIIAWTIERASMVWEEDGAGEATKQLLFSLGACLPCYFLMSNALLQYVFSTFQELNLIVLAAVIMIGTYTGFRLVELRRFKTLVRS